MNKLIHASLDLLIWMPRRRRGYRSPAQLERRRGVTVASGACGQAKGERSWDGGGTWSCSLVALMACLLEPLAISNKMDLGQFLRSAGGANTTKRLYGQGAGRRSTPVAGLCRVSGPVCSDTWWIRDNTWLFCSRKDVATVALFAGDVAVAKEPKKCEEGEYDPESWLHAALWHSGGVLQVISTFFVLSICPLALARLPLA